tara:strand:- start:1265 stop:2089 length:825 start_codon:yes stop_codon:yes gene_type:complete
MSNLEDSIKIEDFPSTGSHELAIKEAISQFRFAIEGGKHWFEALLNAVGSWKAPEETVDDMHYKYLYDGEAFDWMRLAERLCDVVPELISSSEVEGFLFRGKWPLQISEEEFEKRLGAWKYSAHLNYLYGVVVEESLQFAIEEEIIKEQRAMAFPGEGFGFFEQIFVRIYGLDIDRLLARYADSVNLKLGTEFPQCEWRGFLYWLFKFRCQNQDGARVASDTRKGLAMLSRLVPEKNSNRLTSPLGGIAEFEERFIVVGPIDRKVVNPIPSTVS